MTYSSPRYFHKSVRTDRPPDEVFSTLEHALHLHTGGNVSRNHNIVSVHNGNRNVNLMGATLNATVTVTSPRPGLLAFHGEVRAAMSQSALAVTMVVSVLLACLLPFIGVILLCILAVLMMQQGSKMETQYQLALDDVAYRLSDSPPVPQ